MTTGLKSLQPRKYSNSDLHIIIRVSNINVLRILYININHIHIYTFRLKYYSIVSKSINLYQSVPSIFMFGRYIYLECYRVSWSTRTGSRKGPGQAPPSLQLVCQEEPLISLTPRGDFLKPAGPCAPAAVHLWVDGPLPTGDSYDKQR